MRFEGTLKTWNDERGFGFIEPNIGGQEIFVHIKAFPLGFGRPEPQQKLSFEITQNVDGKRKAANVLAIRERRQTAQTNSSKSKRWEKSSLFVLLAFTLFFLLVTLVWQPSVIFLLAYGAMSMVCFLFYDHDKIAAQTGGWRTPESTLLMVGLFCGWPGAIVAQQMFRHKTSKLSFRVAFWMTIAVNIFVFTALATPLMRAVKA